MNDWWHSEDEIELVDRSYELLTANGWRSGWPLIQFLVRFWSRVDRTGACWAWQGSRDKLGYGRLNVEGFLEDVRSTTTGKIALMLTTGGLPPTDSVSGRRMDACHTCDNPPCCRPEHLFFGTRGENMADKLSKGRAKGPITYSDEVIERIVQLNGTMSQARIANLLGCSQAHVSNVLSGKYRRTKGGGAL